ncbi:MAG TPA: hypothetical protein VJ436_01965 [Anaerolineales bacterium]|nr:hypothetical protein [Anaerolineales bacterium]
MEWKEKVLAELALGEAARLAGNEGRARACARRAAGLIVGEYYRRLGRSPASRSAIGHLQYLASQPDTTALVRTAAEYFLMRITPEHEHPLEVDLLAQARWLAQALLLEQV